MKKNVALLDTDAANLHSVYKALKFIGAKAQITKDQTIIGKSDFIVFPGVGAFAAVMKTVKENGLENLVMSSIKDKKPFLGICVGLQVLFDESEEYGKTKGLGILKGKVVKFKKAKKIPHIGWNNITWTMDHGQKTIDNGPMYYFVHSYYVVPQDRSIIWGETNYDGERFVSGVKKDNLIAVQFHPEKSGEVGLDFLKEFIEGNL